ncbi:hypothetical protein ACFQZQ_10820 [Lysobacter koreensis]|uniref:Integron gene cassette protein n=1 Tax=Lysobacter koreensis TaxID=266122 RepID=A0ABW2YN61_9GAMM
MKQLLALMAFPIVARAEVMDKEPSMTSILAMTAVVGFLGFLAARFKPGWLFVLLPITGVLFAAQLIEVHSPDVGPAILQEASFLYVVASWAGPIVQILAVGGGWWLRRRAPNNSFKPKPLRGSA